MLLGTVLTWRDQFVMPVDWSFRILDIFVAFLSTVCYTDTHGQSVCRKGE